MKTTQEDRDHRRKVWTNRAARSPRGSLEYVESRAALRMVDDADELARLRTGLGNLSPSTIRTGDNSSARVVFLLDIQALLDGAP